ncbi:hypothetical protein Tco_1071924 [Tanacetum coccineum]
MTTTTAQQVALDNDLVPLEKRVEIDKCNIRIHPAKTQKEPTYQVVLDALALTTYYHAFLITADVLEIYMHQFWFTIKKRDSSYRLPTQEFDALPLDEEIISFIKELGHKGDIKSITEVVVDHMYQPWRTFAAIINKCLSRKIIGRLHIPNREHRPQEVRKDVLSQIHKSYHSSFHHQRQVNFDENRMFMHTTQDDSILGTMRFVSKSKDFQIYGAVLPNRMTNQQIRDFDAYKTYLAYATEEKEPELAKKTVSSKKLAAKRQSAGV